MPHIGGSINIFWGPVWADLIVVHPDFIQSTAHRLNLAKGNYGMDLYVHDLEVARHEERVASPGGAVQRGSKVTGSAPRSYIKCGAHYKT